MSRPPYALYNPALLPPEVLLEEFTARRGMLETLLGIVRSNKIGHPPQHCLLIGARGMGKTTTLWALAHSVARDAELARQWQPVVFDEESRRVGDLADFWLEAIRQWEYATGSKSGRAEKLLSTANADIEDRARQTFLELVETSGRRALLLVDNLNELLGAIHDPEPLHRLRAFLMKDSRVMIIGVATRYFEAITSVDQPFYDFFRCFDLRPLSLEEMRECLLVLAQKRKDPVVEKTLQERSGTVHALHILTGGNPRVIKTFYRLLAEGLRGDIRMDLEGLLDDFTPYFKSMVDALPVQQQRIFDAVALAWDPVEVARLSQATRLPSNQVSAQLRALIKSGLVAEAMGHPKKKTYLLADRFSNIHYLMRHGRAARNRFDWFVALVQLVFPDKDGHDVLARAAREAAECGPEGILDARAILQSAFSRTSSPEDRRAMLHATFRENWNRETLASLEQWFDAEAAGDGLPETDVLAFCSQMPAELRQKLGCKPDVAEWWYKLTDFLEEKERWQLAEAAYYKAIELDPKDAYPWNGLGNVLQGNLSRPEEAEVAYCKAIELNPKFVRPWNNLGNVLQAHLDRPEEAEAAYFKAIELDPKGANQWNGMGTVLQKHLGRPAESEAAYRKAIELNSNDAYPWNNLGTVLQEHLGRPEEAEAAYRKAIELDPKYARAWNNLGTVLQKHLGRLAEAEAAYRKAIELDPKYANPWSRLANLLHFEGRNAEEAKNCAVTALPLKPDYAFARWGFLKLCADHAPSWKAVLPALAAWCVAHSTAQDVYDFTMDGFVRLAQLTQPAEVLAIIDGLQDASPFETLRDAFLAHANREHLHRLAPEKQAVVLELLKKLEPEKKPVPKKRQKKSARQK